MAHEYRAHAQLRVRKTDDISLRLAITDLIATGHRTFPPAQIAIPGYYRLSLREAARIAHTICPSNYITGISQSTIGELKIITMSSITIEAPRRGRANAKITYGERLSIDLTGQHAQNLAGLMYMICVTDPQPSWTATPVRLTVSGPKDTRVTIQQDFSDPFLGLCFSRSCD